MAYLPEPILSDAVSKTPVAVLRKSYIKISEAYQKLNNREILYCEHCGKPKSCNSFYKDVRFYSGYNTLYCKDCIQKIAEGRTKDDDEPQETKASVRAALKILDKPFFNSMYDDAVRAKDINTGEKTKRSIFSYMIPQLYTLVQYVGKKYRDSDPDDESVSEDDDIDVYDENSRAMKQGRKIFGDGFSAYDIKYLYNEWRDWKARYEFENKAQEVLLKQVCFKQLEIDKLTRQGKDTSKQVKDLQELMGSLNVKPNQSTSDGNLSAKCFGQLIDEWEEHDPVIEPQGEFKDPDHMVFLVEGFFKGHLSKMMGLKNAFSHIYDVLMQKYTVAKEVDEDDEADNEALFNKIFGSEIRKEESNE